MEDDPSQTPIKLASEPDFAVGGLHVRPSTLELVGAAGPERLEPRIMQVLVALARRRGEFVSRESLNELCWAGRAVADDAINRCISRLRQCARAQGGFEIATLPRVGYRLVERGAAASAKPAPAHASIAVLPFTNMSGDPEQAYFSDGITEDIITDLARISSVFVVARNTAFAVRGEISDPRDVAARLGVRHVLAGSVRKADGRVRISTQLVDGETGRQVWAERFDRDLEHIFKLQDEISRSIVDALRVRLLPTERAAISKRGTGSVEAYDLLLKARQIYTSGDQGDPRWAASIIELCDRALRIDEGYANAWSQLALGYVAASYLHGGGMAAALPAAERALALDPELGEAHAVRARYLADTGQAEAAQRAIAIALRCAPESWLVHYSAGVIFELQGEISAAATHFEAAQALDETEFISPQFLIGCYRRLGDPDGVRRAAEITLAHADNALKQDTANGFALAVSAHALGVLGRLDLAGDRLDRALELDPNNVNVRLNAALTLAEAFDEIDAALDVLAPAMETMGWGLLDLTKRNAGRLAAHPRFRTMIASAEARLARVGDLAVRA